MYAVVKAGGRQIRVSPGQMVRIDKVDAEVGGILSFNHVLMVGGGEQVQVGAPTLTNVSLEAEILAHGKADKVIIFKQHRRKNYRRKRGFRAEYTLVRIGNLLGYGGEWMDGAEAQA